MTDPGRRRRRRPASTARIIAAGTAATTTFGLIAVLGHDASGEGVATPTTIVTVPAAALPPPAPPTTLAQRVRLPLAAHPARTGTPLPVPRSARSGLRTALPATTIAPRPAVTVPPTPAPTVPARRVRPVTRSAAS